MQIDASKHSNIPVNLARSSDLLKNQSRDEFWDNDTTMGVPEFEASVSQDEGQNHQPLIKHLQLQEITLESIEVPFTYNEHDSQPPVAMESSQQKGRGAARKSTGHDTRAKDVARTTLEEVSASQVECRCRNTG
jgi:hypothetical protein